MEELIKGVEILKTNNYYCPTAFAIVVMIVVCIILLAIFIKFDDYELLSMLSCAFALIIPFALLIFIVSGKITHPIWSRCYTTEYECYLHEDEISFKEFNENLEIIQQDGKIFIIKEKDK